MGKSQQVQVIELDPGRIDVLRRVVLSDLSGRVRVRASWPDGRIGVLIVRRSPQLEWLDLLDCPGGMRIELDPDSVPPQLMLPRKGCWLNLRLADRWPLTEIHGKAERVLIEIAAGGELDQIHGYYGFKDIAGLKLMSGTELVQSRAIHHYLRIDQSVRGLQLKNLPRRSRPESVLWQLYPPARAECGPHVELLSLDTAGLEELALGQAEQLALRRQQLFKRMLERASMRHGPLGISPLKLLVLLRQRGCRAEVVWALRCFLQAFGNRDVNRFSLASALLAAKPGWRPDHRSRTYPTYPRSADLELFALCRDSRWTTRFAARLGRLERPAEVLELAGLVRRLGSDHRLYPEVIAALRQALINCRKYLVEFSQRNDVLSAGLFWHVKQDQQMRQLVCEIGLLEDAECRQRALTLGMDFLEPEARIVTGIELMNSGLKQARGLIASGLQTASGLDADLRSEALGRLLAPCQGVQRPDVAATVVERQSMTR